MLLRHRAKRKRRKPFDLRRVFCRLRLSCDVCFLLHGLQFVQVVHGALRLRRCGEYRALVLA
jgi:hypothetical protein